MKVCNGEGGISSGNQGGLPRSDSGLAIRGRVVVNYVCFGAGVGGSYGEKQCSSEENFCLS